MTTYGIFLHLICLLNIVSEFFNEQTTRVVNVVSVLPQFFHRGNVNFVERGNENISYVFICVYLKMTSGECHNCVKIIKK